MTSVSLLLISSSVKNVCGTWDSIMVDNGCRKLSRLQTAHVIIRSALGPFEENGFDIPENLHHYVEKFDENKVTYHDHRPAEVKKEEAFRDAFDLYRNYPEDLKSAEEFKQLDRFVKEQINQSESNEFEGVKPGKELPSTTLNNPAEPESTTRTKAGKLHLGYVGNFVETVDNDTNRKFIDSADFQPNIYSDSQFAKDEIDRMKERNHTTPLVTDGAYSGVDNVNLAAEAGIELLGTDLAGRKTPDLMADFEIDEENGTVICPNGQKPVKCTKSESAEGYWVSFDKKICDTCPLREQCPLKNRKRVRSGRVSAKMVQRAQLQRTIGSESYMVNYRFRNGVEAIPSQLRRKQKIGHMPYRGLVRKKFGFRGAILGINIRRALRYAMEDAQKASKSLYQKLLFVIFVKFGVLSQRIFKLG